MICGTERGEKMRIVSLSSLLPAVRTHNCSFISLIPGEAIRGDYANIPQGKQIAQIETSSASSRGPGFWGRVGGGWMFEIPNREAEEREREAERQKDKSHVRNKKTLLQKRRRMGKAHE